VQDTVEARSVETKTWVFISYSRKDMAFADRLEAALKARGFEVQIDRTEIYAFEDWWKRIQSPIGQSDNQLFADANDVAATQLVFDARRPVARDVSTAPRGLLSYSAASQHGSICVLRDPDGHLISLEVSRGEEC
jgi:hypothetical protein